MISNGKIKKENEQNKKGCQPVLIFQTTNLGYYTKNTLNEKITSSIPSKCE
jgi:hypothetical protein